MSAITTEKAIELITTELDSCRKSMERFQKRLAERPADALESCESAMEAAASIEIYQRGLNALKTAESPTSKWNPETLAEYFEKEALNGARFVKQSTSQTSNLMKLFRMSAATELSRVLRGELF